MCYLFGFEFFVVFNSFIDYLTDFECFISVDSSIYETANLGNSRITQLYNPMDLCDRARYDDIAHYETSNLGDIIQSGYFNTNSEPYPAQQSDGAYLQEEPRMDSRGEGRC